MDSSSVGVAEAVVALAEVVAEAVAAASELAAKRMFLSCSCGRGDAMMSLNVILPLQHDTLPVWGCCAAPGKLSLLFA